jgi:hypothetical protein
LLSLPPLLKSLKFTFRLQTKIHSKFSKIKTLPLLNFSESSLSLFHSPTPSPIHHITLKLKKSTLSLVQPLATPRRLPGNQSVQPSSSSSFSSSYFFF